MFESKKRVYRFGGKSAEGDGTMRELLGGKGANLAEMSRLGMPVPAGFTITTECCAEYYELGGGYTDALRNEVAEALAATEALMGKKFGDENDPLLVSCRSGARSSMPGMMDTILNIGLCSATLPGMIKKTGNPRFVYDAYRRLIMMYSDVVMEKAEGIEPADGQGIRQQLDRMMQELKDAKGYKSDTDITAEELQVLCEQFKAKVKEVLGVEFPDTAKAQLWGSIGGVFKSWNGKRAIAYRRIEKIPDDWGTAVNVQSMVFGNMGDNSATGVAFSRNPASGDNKFYGEWLINAQGGIQFELNCQDDEHDAEKAVNAYNTLMDWGMQMMLGTVTTGPCIAVSAEAYNDRVIMLTPSASSTDVLTGHDNVFQVCFTDPNQGVASADYIAENFAGAKTAVIYKNDDAYSQGIRDTFVKEAGAKGLEVVYEGTFTEDTQTDFSVQLTAAQTAGADMVFLPIYYTPASVIFKQANDMGYAPKFFGVDGMDGILTGVEGFDTSLAEGVLLLTPFAADAQDERTQNFVAKYQEAYGDIPTQFAADAYDGIYIFKQALEAAGCTSDMSYSEICEALVKVMPTISVDGLTGDGMTWAASGEVSKAPRAVVIENGAYVTP